MHSITSFTKKSIVFGSKKLISLSIGLILTSTTFASGPLNLDWIDKSINPQEDFFTFANGNWIKNNPIPNDYPSWGAFSVLEEENRNKIHAMLIKLSKENNIKPGSVEQKVGDFYYSGMDVKSIEKLGVTPLAPEFARINAIANIQDLEKEIIHLHKMGLMVIFGFGSMQDFADSKKVIAAVDQGGLSLPNRDYYLSKDKKFVKIRAEYIKHVTKMFMLLGDSKQLALDKAKKIMKLEKTLAKASMTQVKMRDPKAVYNIMNIAKLNKLTPNFSWKEYLAAMGFADMETLNIGMPKYMQAVDKALSDYSLSDWKTYLTWHLLSGVSPYLSNDFVMQNFEMAKVLSGIEELPPRWKRVVSSENKMLGFAVGELFVEKYFSASAKQEVIDIIRNIREVLRTDLKELSWMTPKTRDEAIKKLNLIEERVGYPDKWRDYSTLKIDKGPYVLNVLRASEFAFNYDLNKIGKPVDRTEWEMTPQTVNAYYHPSLNSINIPMGILSSPYFDPNAPESVNYGAIGVIIGHEITHGFDDQGAKFDAYGNLLNWWQKEDLDKFQKATKCIVNQYSQYKINGDIPLKGKLVVGEATADLGGLILAYRAYLRSEAFKTAKTIDGFTPIQQFFLSFAHIWANQMRPEYAMNLVVVDQHPPAKYRVNGTLANMKEFQESFNVLNDSPMVNANRCVIW